MAKKEKFDSKQKAEAMRAAYVALIEEQQQALAAHKELIATQEREITNYIGMANAAERKYSEQMGKEGSKVVNEFYSKAVVAYQEMQKNIAAMKSPWERQQHIRKWEQQKADILRHAEDRLKALEGLSKGAYRYSDVDLMGLKAGIDNEAELAKADPKALFDDFRYGVEETTPGERQKMKQDVVAFRQEAEKMHNELQGIKAESEKLNQETQKLVAEQRHDMSSLNSLVDLHERTKKHMKKHYGFFTKAVDWLAKKSENSKLAQLFGYKGTVPKRVEDYRTAKQVKNTAEMLISDVSKGGPEVAKTNPGYMVAKAMSELEKEATGLANQNPGKRRQELLSIVDQGLLEIDKKDGLRLQQEEKAEQRSGKTPG